MIKYVSSYIHVINKLLLDELIFRSADMNEDIQF